MGHIKAAHKGCAAPGHHKADCQQQVGLWCGPATHACPGNLCLNKLILASEDGLAEDDVAIHAAHPK